MEVGDVARQGEHLDDALVRGVHPVLGPAVPLGDPDGVVYIFLIYLAIYQPP